MRQQKGHQLEGSASITVAAPPDRVYALVADVARMGEWSPECTGATWLDGAQEPSPGARFKGTNRRGRATWSTTCTVLVADPGRALSFATGRTDRPDTVWTYHFEPSPGGGTTVTESFRVHRYGLGQQLTNRYLLGTRDRRADMVHGVEQTLARLKAAAEAGEQAPAET